MVCPSVRAIIHLLKLMDYLLIHHGITITKITFEMANRTKLHEVKYILHINYEKQPYKSIVFLLGVKNEKQKQ